MQVLSLLLATAFLLIGTLVAICMVIPYIIILFVPLAGVFYYIQKVYQDSAQVACCGFLFWVTIHFTILSGNNDTMSTGTKQNPNNNIKSVQVIYTHMDTGP